MRRLVVMDNIFSNSILNPNQNDPKTNEAQILRQMKDKYPRCTDNALLLLRAKYDTIEKIKALAEERGGKCLTDQFINISAKLTWSCGKIHDGKNIHTWEQFLDPIIEGAWCQKCRHALRKLNTKDVKHY